MRPDQKPWTPRETARLRAMREAGYDMEAIALAVGHSCMACATKASQLGVYKPGRRKPVVAIEARPPVLADGQRWRACLNCRNSFRSEGPHNRLCTSCRGVSLSPLDVPARVSR